MKYIIHWTIVLTLTATSQSGKPYVSGYQITGKDTTITNKDTALTFYNRKQMEWVNRGGTGQQPSLKMVKTKKK
jgi:hypothetical protein